MPRSTRRPDPRSARPQGALTALVTPFTEDGAVDEVAFRRLVSWQILSGIDGLVPCGTTGESPTLSRRTRATDRHHGRAAARGPGAAASP